jgi:polysaccharide export outer membrane protein
MKSFLKFFFNISACIILTSCASIKNVKYFSDVSDSTKFTALGSVPYTEPTINTDDILSVNIQTNEPEAAQTVSMGNIQNSAVGATTAGSTGGQTVSGYLVDKEGMIELPIIGRIKVLGLTTQEARNLIRSKANQYYKNPAVNIRFANFKITILGEVAKPGTYVVSNERVNILDALGLAGDLTIYGKRNNITLIRQNVDGNRILVKLDLTKKEILNSPYYYLNKNDYIYVEPGNSKIVSSDSIQNRNISIVTAIGASLISVLAILLSTNKL